MALQKATGPGRKRHARAGVQQMPGGRTYAPEVREITGAGMPYKRNKERAGAYALALFSYWNIAQTW